MLTLQIALGIFLGFLLIQYRQSLAEIFKVILLVALVVVTVVAGIAAIKAGAQSAGIDFGAITGQALNALATMATFFCSFVGALGTVTFFNIFAMSVWPKLQTPPIAHNLPTVVIAIIFNFVVMVAIDVWLPGNPLSVLSDHLDALSRQAGYKDAYPVLYASFLSAAAPWSLVGVAAWLLPPPTKPPVEDAQHDKQFDEQD